MKKTVLWCLAVLCVFGLTGCGKKADETKPIAEVKAEAEKMDVKDLKAMAMTYKDAIAAKSKDIEKITAQLKKIPATELLGNEAKGLKADIDNLTKSAAALKERFQVYYDKLKEKGGDVAGLQL